MQKNHSLPVLFILWCWGCFVTLIGVTFTLVIAGVTIPFGIMYEVFDFVVNPVRSSPLPYVSAFYHSCIYHVCYKWLLRVEMVNVGKMPEPHTGNSVVLVTGNHPPLLLLMPHYFLICKFICKELLVTIKRSTNPIKDAFIVLMVLVLASMQCLVLLARGNSSDRNATLANFKRNVNKHLQLRRALTLFVDMSRPNKKKISVDRARFSRILLEKYGINDDLCWLTSTLFPRVHGFSTAIEALPADARVLLLFMVADKQIWNTLQFHKLPGLKVRYWFHETKVAELKQKENESRDEWLERLTVFLMNLWITVNLRHNSWQNV